MLQGLDSCSALLYLVTLLLLSVVPAAALRSLRDTMERSREGWWPTPWWRTFHWRFIEKVLIQGWWTPQKSEKTVSSQTFCQQVPARSFGVLLINVFFRWKSSPILTEIAYIQRDPHILDNSGFRLFFDFFDFFRKNHENVQIRTKGFFAFFRFFRLLGDPPDGKKSWKTTKPLVRMG